MKIKCPNCGKIQNIPDIYVNRKTVKCVRCKVEIPVTLSKSSFPKKPVLIGFAVFFGLLVLIIMLVVAIPSSETTKLLDKIDREPHEFTEQKKYNREVEKGNYQTVPKRHKPMIEEKSYQEPDSIWLKSGATVIIQAYVKSQLLCPSTADFPWMMQARWDDTSGTYKCSSYVDSQNAFGATLRKEFFCEVKFLGGEDVPENWKIVSFLWY